MVIFQLVFPRSLRPRCQRAVNFGLWTYGTALPPPNKLIQASSTLIPTPLTTKGWHIKLQVDTRYPFCLKRRNTREIGDTLENESATCDPCYL